MNIYDTFEYRRAVQDKADDCVSDVVIAIEEVVAHNSDARMTCIPDYAAWALAGAIEKLVADRIKMEIAKLGAPA